MKSRDPLSSAYHFASSLVQDPGKTLLTTWKGATSPINVENGFGHIFGGLGATFTTVGALTANPLLAGIGIFEVAHAAGRYLTAGESLTPGGSGGNIPPPPAELLPPR